MSLILSIAKSIAGGMKIGMASTNLEVAVYVTAFFAAALDLP